jgi:hypothetical protein
LVFASLSRCEECDTLSPRREFECITTFPTTNAAQDERNFPNRTFMRRTCMHALLSGIQQGKESGK